MASFAVEPAALAAFVPAGTALDFYRGQTFVSLVGFRFLRTRLLGGRLGVPWHRDFDEVNLRFYVRRADPRTGEVRRGTVFIKEIVPRLAIALVARLCYRENYAAAPMRSRLAGPDPAAPDEVAFSWKFAGAWHQLAGRADGPARESAPGSVEEFITEHYWGYSDRASHGQRTLEYAVEHPRWRVRAVRDFQLALPAAAALYGPALAAALGEAPASVFLADGSAVRVYRGVPISG